MYWTASLKPKKYRMAPTSAMTQMPKMASTSPRKWKRWARNETSSLASSSGLAQAVLPRSLLRACCLCSCLCAISMKNPARNVWTMAQTKMMVATMLKPF